MFFADNPRLSLLSLCFALCWLTGCSADNGIQRYQRTGSVTFQGEPVPKGEIIFSPDRSKGGSGPGTTVTFENGTFRTREGQGVVSGPHVVQITGFDGNTGSSTGGEVTHPWGKVLFVERRFPIDFPPEDSEHEFDLTQ